MASMCTAHGNRHMLLSVFPGCGVPLAENTQPPLGTTDHILAVD
jgi:hypothetical protein